MANKIKFNAEKLAAAECRAEYNRDVKEVNERITEKPDKDGWTVVNSKPKHSQDYIREIASLEKDYRIRQSQLSWCYKILMLSRQILFKFHAIFYHYGYNTSGIDGVLECFTLTFSKVQDNKLYATVDEDDYEFLGTAHNEYDEVISDYDLENGFVTFRSIEHKLRFYLGEDVSPNFIPDCFVKHIDPKCESFQKSEKNYWNLARRCIAACFKHHHDSFLTKRCRYGAQCNNYRVDHLINFSH